MRRSRAIGPQKWRDPLHHLVRVVTGDEARKGMFYNERIGIGIGTLTSFQTLDWIVQMRIISEGGGEENGATTFYFPTSIDLPSPLDRFLPPFSTPF